MPFPPIRTALLVAFLLYQSGLRAQPAAGAAPESFRISIDTVACGLEVPWSLAFDGPDLYVTERGGRLLLLKGGAGTPVVLGRIPGVHAQGEGGLMGLALDTDFRRSRRLYVGYTRRKTDGTVVNRVSSFLLGSDGPSGERVFVDDLPGGNVHNGCRLKIGPDGMLYVSTGDAARRQEVQNLSWPGGKVLRLTTRGEVPADNPWPGSAVFVTGLRNPQGLAWDSAGRLIISDHGPSGFDGPGGGDEINAASSGDNMGWPIVHHGAEQEGLVSPLFEFTPAIAPSGIAVARNPARHDWRGGLFVACLRGRQLLKLDLGTRAREVVLSGYGRLRDVVEGPDGWLYVTTSNRDGRGNPGACDDAILRIRSTR